MLTAAALGAVAALAVPLGHRIVAIDQPTGVVEVASPLPVGAALGGNCPGPIPPGCDRKLSQLATYWNFIDWPEWPYWALEMKVGCGGFCHGCDTHNWNVCDIQDAYVGVAGPDGSLAADARFKPFEIIGEGIYAHFMDPAQPQPDWYGPVTFVPRLHQITYDDPVLDSHPPPNAVWWFSSMSNLDPWVWEYGEWRQCEECLPDMYLSGDGWEPLCLVLQDVFYSVTSLGFYVEWACPTDFTGDGRTNVEDFLFLLENWDTFGVLGLLEVLARWGGCPYT
jgi:hypothetical protein